MSSVQVCRLCQMNGQVDAKACHEDFPTSSVKNSPNMSLNMHIFAVG